MREFWKKNNLTFQSNINGQKAAGKGERQTRAKGGGAIVFLGPEGWEVNGKKGNEFIKKKCSSLINRKKEKK